MSTAPVVRAMRASDLPRVTDLSAQLGYAASFQDLQARFATVLRRPEQGLFVAVNDDRVLGWLHAQSQHPLESEAYLEIMGLVVARDARRCGAGRALVERARQWAGELGYARVRVRSNVLRTEAHAFYPALGFRLVKTQHTYERDVRS